MFRFVTAVVLAMALTAPCFAQAINIMGERGKRVTDEDVAKQKADEDAYKAGLSKIPDKKTSKDPWGAVRSDTPATTAAKPKK